MKVEGGQTELRNKTEGSRGFVEGNRGVVEGSRGVGRLGQQLAVERHASKPPSPAAWRGSSLARRV